MLPRPNVRFQPSDWTCPRAGGTQRLTRLLGLARSKSLIFAAKVLDAAQAHELGSLLVALVTKPALCSHMVVGLIDYLASPGETASDRATALAKEILPNGRSSEPWLSDCPG